MDNFPYLFAAYTIVWLVVFGYILVLFVRQNQLKRELDSWKKALQEKDPRKD